MESLFLREGRAGNNVSRLSYDMPASPYISGIAEQAQHIRALQERVSALEEALKRERHRADLCQQQLEQCIAAAAAQAATASATAAASALALNSPPPPQSPPPAPSSSSSSSPRRTTAASTGPAAVPRLWTGSRGMFTEGRAEWQALSSSPHCGPLLPRSSLEASPVVRTQHSATAAAATAGAQLAVAAATAAGTSATTSSYLQPLEFQSVSPLRSALHLRPQQRQPGGERQTAGAEGYELQQQPVVQSGEPGAPVKRAVETPSPRHPSYPPSSSSASSSSRPSAMEWDCGRNSEGNYLHKQQEQQQQQQQHQHQHSHIYMGPPAIPGSPGAAGEIPVVSGVVTASTLFVVAEDRQMHDPGCGTCTGTVGISLRDFQAALPARSYYHIHDSHQPHQLQHPRQHHTYHHLQQQQQYQFAGGCGGGGGGCPWNTAGDEPSAAAEAAEETDVAVQEDRGPLPGATACTCAADGPAAPWVSYTALASHRIGFVPAAAAGIGIEPLAAGPTGTTGWDGVDVGVGVGVGVGLDGSGSGSGAGGEEFVTITKREYELLLLKDKAMDVLQEGITIADCSVPDMPLIYANAGFVRTTGYSVDYVIGKNCRFLQGEGTDSQPVRELKEAITQGRACVVQLLNYKKNGDPFVNYLSLTPIYDTTTGRLTHYVGVQSDITELVNHKKAELAAKHAALQAAVATEAKSQFLARMSHEIRTPLNGMIAVGQLLAETSLTPAQWDLVNTIRCSGETLLTLITDILDFSRIEANKMVLHNAVFKLDTVIEAAMEIAGLKAAQRRLQVAYHIAENMPRMLYGDAQRLQQILLNILNNGIKFTEEGELLLEVWLEGIFPSNAMATAMAAAAAGAAAAAAAAAAAKETRSGEKASDVEAAATDGGDAGLPYRNPDVVLQPGAAAAAATSLDPTVVAAAAPSLLPAATAAATATGPEAEWPLLVLRFSVRDTGIGIDPADLGRLFNSFTQVDASPTRRYGGSGLGLAISRKLCEAMGGQMWAESEGLNKGSTFSWTITCRLPQQAASKRRVRRASLVCVSRPPIVGSGVAGSSGFMQALGSSGPGSSVGAGNSSSVGSAAMAVATAAAVAAPLTSPRGQNGAGRGGSSGAAATGAPPSLPPALMTDEEYDVTSCRSSEGSMDKSAGTTSASSSAMIGSTAGGAVSSSCTGFGGGSGSYGTAGSQLPPSSAAAMALPAGMTASVAAGVAPYGVADGGSGSGGSDLGNAAGNIQRTISSIPALPWTWSAGGSYAGSCGGGRDGYRTSATGGGLNGAGSSNSLHDGVSYGLTNGAVGCLASALTGSIDPTTCLPLLRGKKVLLVEPCIMVLQVLMLALRSWGCRVCAVVSSYDAIRRLVASGTLTETLAPPRRPEPPRRPCMTLRHAGIGSELDPSLYDMPGPYDCVIMDMKDTALLRALTRADDREAQRLVFMGWPGQNEPEEDEDGLDSPARRPVPDMDLEHEQGHSQQVGEEGASRPVWQHQQRLAEAPACVVDGGEGSISVVVPPAPGPYDFAEPLPADVTARPPRAVTEEMSKPQNRQLGYVTVTRPVRQGRLKLALEEVLMMQLDGGTSHHQHCWSDDGVDDSPPLPSIPYASTTVAAANSANLRSLDISAFLDDVPQQQQQPQPSLTAAAAVMRTVTEALPSETGTRLTLSSSSSLRSSPAPSSSVPNQHQQQSQNQPQRQYLPLEGAADILHPSPADLPAASGPSGDGTAAGGGVTAAGPLSSGPSSSTAPASPCSPATWRNSFEYGTGGGGSGGGGGGSHGGSSGATGTHGAVHGHGHGSSSLCSSLKPALVKKSGSNAELNDLSNAAAAAAAAATAGSEAGGGTSGPGCVRILLAEDNAINMKVALGILKRTLPFAEVTTAENGVQALDAVAAHGGIDAFDLVLMDLHMPVMGGMEAVAELEQRYPNRRCRVVAVTADAFEDTRDSCLAAGFDGWLTKPFRIEDLVRVVGEHLVAARAAPVPQQHHHHHLHHHPHLHHPHPHLQQQPQRPQTQPQQQYRSSTGGAASVAQHRLQQQQRYTQRPQLSQPPQQ